MPIWLIVVLILAALLLLWVISGYNRFIRLRNKVEEAFSTMDVYLKKRYDLIPNLVETIKGYTKHESGTLEKVVAARNRAMKSETLEDKIASEKQFQSALGSFFAIAEAYPELKADTHYKDLMDQLQHMETEIANARKYYNAVTMKFNNAVEMFPSSLLAGIFHFKRKPLYEIADQAQRDNVKVQF